jgi:hypothetical protein
MVTHISRPAGRWRRAALVWLALLTTGYGAAMVFLWHTQESRLFLPRTVDEARAASVMKQLPNARHVWLQARDGTRLHGWFLPANPGAPSGRVLLYFGGNAEDVHWRLARVERFAGWDILLTDYRGYGLSAGTPGQAAMQEDALLWHDRLVTGVDGLPPASAVTVMGTSLGSYFATHVAAQRPVRGVVLATPFDSVRDYVQTRMPIVPVGLLLRHPLDSRTWAPSVKAPTLFIVAEQDTTIPPERARILARNWGGRPLEAVLVPQSNHNTVSAEPLYWEALARFLSSL